MGKDFIITVKLLKSVSLSCLLTHCGVCLFVVDIEPEPTDNSAEARAAVTRGAICLSIPSEQPEIATETDNAPSPTLSQQPQLIRTASWDESQSESPLARDASKTSLDHNTPNTFDQPGPNS